MVLFAGYDTQQVNSDTYFLVRKEPHSHIVPNLYFEYLYKCTVMVRSHSNNNCIALESRLSAIHMTHTSFPQFLLDF